MSLSDIINSDMSTPEEKLFELLKDLKKKLPSFPDGRINYKDSDIAPVITVFVSYEGKILLLKRSDKVNTYQGKWNTVAGYIDQIRPLKEKVLEELREELSINESMISNIKYGDTHTIVDKDINKTWVIHPILVTLNKKPEIVIDWEHTEFAWIDPKDLNTYDVVPSLQESYKGVI